MSAVNESSVGRHGHDLKSRELPRLSCGRCPRIITERSTGGRERKIHEKTRVVHA